MRIDFLYLDYVGVCMCVCKDRLKHRIENKQKGPRPHGNLSSLCPNVILRTFIHFIVQVLASQLFFVANRNAEMTYFRQQTEWKSGEQEASAYFRFSGKI